MQHRAPQPVVLPSITSFSLCLWNFHATSTVCANMCQKVAGGRGCKTSVALSLIQTLKYQNAKEELTVLPSCSLGQIFTFSPKRRTAPPCIHCCSSHGKKTAVQGVAFDLYCLDQMSNNYIGLKDYNDEGQQRKNR